MDLNVEDKTKFVKMVIFGTFEKGFENQNGEKSKEPKAQEIKLDRDLTTINLFHAKNGWQKVPCIEEMTRLWKVVKMTF